MNKRRVFLVTVCVAFIFVIVSLLPASDLRVKALGDLSLVIEDSDNQLNLHDCGLNPAWLMVDQQRSWLRPFFTSDVSWGKFKRIYDPETVMDLNAFVEGIKVMDENQTFRGVVNYHNLNLKDVYQAINREPYLEHPFRLADNTFGSIHYWGPAVSAEYSRNVYDQKLFMGASLDYRIETGLKDLFPQPRMIYRQVGFGSGIAYRLSDRFVIGTTFKYAHTQEFTECVTPSSNESRSILVMKFRGESIGSERLGNMERFTKTKMFQWGVQSHYKLRDNFECAFSFNYHFQNLDATENRTKPAKDGTWKLNGYEIHWKNRLRMPHAPFRLGLSVSRIYFNDWAIHPNFDVLLGDDHFTEHSLGFGFAYEPHALPLIVGMEYHLQFVEKDKKDYVSRMSQSGNRDGADLKIGAEYGLLDNLKIRAGYIFNQHRIDPSLLAFSEFLPDNKIHTITFGIGWFLKSIEIDFYTYFGQQKPGSDAAAFKRNLFGSILSVTFYRD